MLMKVERTILLENQEKGKQLRMVEYLVDGESDPRGVSVELAIWGSRGISVESAELNDENRHQFVQKYIEA